MSELKELLVSGQALDQALVATALKPLLRIDEETGAIRPQSAWRKASNDARVLGCLLARKAARALGINAGEEAMSPKQIISETGLPAGSVYPSLKALYERRPQVVDKDAKSRYWIPNWAVDEAADIIGKATGG